MGNSELIIHSILTCNLEGFTFMFMNEGVSCKHVTIWGSSQIIDDCSLQTGRHTIRLLALVS